MRGLARTAPTPDNAPMDSITSLERLRAAWQPLNDAHRSGRRYSDGVHLRIYRCLSWADRPEAVVATTDDPMRWLHGLPEDTIESAEIGIDRLEDLYQLLLADSGGDE